MRVAGARGVVEPQHWPQPPLALPAGAASGVHAETRALEERRLREALDRAHGNKTRAARSLGLSRQGLLKKLRRYGLLAESLADAGPEDLDGDDAVDALADPGRDSGAAEVARV